MRKLILILSLITLPIISFGQISEKKFNNSIEWINHNPSESENPEFTAKSVNLISFHLYKYPNFSINVSGTKELDEAWKGYKYRAYFLIVYSYNQLYYRLKNKKFNSLDACVFSIIKVLESYSLIIANNPELKIKTLDEYKELDKKKLRKRIKKLL